MTPDRMRAQALDLWRAVDQTAPRLIDFILGAVRGDGEAITRLEKVLSCPEVRTTLQ
jgi:hypothetical protein